MSAPKRRKVTFHDLEREDDPERKPIKPSRFKEKHSLDSDEEDDEKGKESGRGVPLSDDEIEGEEEKTIDFNEGGVRMTPFNLKEEMEEGYFDQSGHYIATKDSNQVDDNWLESVDWKQVHQKSTEKELDDLGGDEDDDDEGREDVNVLDAMKEMLELLRPGETVTKALRRLGGNDKKKKRNIRSKYSLEETDEDNCDGDDGDKVGLLKLTELADRLLGAGHQDVYAFSYEKIAYEVKSGGGGGKGIGGSDEVTWYYKWENTDEAKAYGPYSSTQMMEWADQDFFKNGVWVRKATDAEGNFYSSKRIDFGLYVE